MNKLHLCIVAAAVLLGGCGKPGGTPAAEAQAPPPEAAAASVPAATAVATPTVETASAAPEAPDDNAANAAIDQILGDHTQYQAVINAYRKAVIEHDEEGVAALIAYPFTATLDGKPTSIKDAADFVRNYDRIVTPSIARVIEAQKYSELMVSGKGVMFGSGETWINGICKQGSADCSEFEVKVVAIQPGGSG